MDIVLETPYSALQSAPSTATAPLSVAPEPAASPLSTRQMGQCRRRERERLDRFNVNGRRFLTLHLPLPHFPFHLSLPPIDSIQPPPS